MRRRFLKRTFYNLFIAKNYRVYLKGLNSFQECKYFSWNKECLNVSWDEPFAFNWMIVFSNMYLNSVIFYLQLTLYTYNTRSKFLTTELLVFVKSQLTKNSQNSLNLYRYLMDITMTVALSCEWFHRHKNTLLKCVFIWMGSWIH